MNAQRGSERSTTVAARPAGGDWGDFRADRGRDTLHERKRCMIVGKNTARPALCPAPYAGSA